MLTRQVHLIASHSPPRSSITFPVNPLERKTPFVITEIKEEGRKNYVIKDNRSNELEKEGRWTKQEHQKFLEAIKIYGKNWRLVQHYVGTRNATQARSHAQKYFAKLQKTKTNGADDCKSMDNNQLLVSNLCLGTPGRIKTKLSYLENQAIAIGFAKRPKLFSIERKYTRPEQDLEELCRPATIEPQKKFTSELPSIFEPDRTPPTYEPCFSTPQELDLDLPLFNPSEQVDGEGEGIEYPDIPLVIKYPTLSSLFE